MKDKEIKGFYNLAKKTFSVIAASIAVLGSNSAQSADLPSSHHDINDNVLSYNKRLSKPKLVLKLNINNPHNSIITMHTSHRSHSSHSSHSSGYYGGGSGHSSHSSHSSHYSSSPTYTPTPAPSYTPAPRPVYRPSRSTYSPPKSNTVADYSSFIKTDTARVLYKGCKGEDVMQLQNLLLIAGYDTPLSGYFGDQTEVAVKKFQRSKDLPVDGKVGKLTLSMLKEL